MTDFRLNMILFRLKGLQATGYLDGLVMHPVYKSLSVEDKQELIIKAQADIKELMLNHDIQTSF